jgi:hypothetical protein
VAWGNSWAICPSRTKNMDELMGEPAEPLEALHTALQHDELVEVLIRHQIWNFLPGDEKIQLTDRLQVYLN